MVTTEGSRADPGAGAGAVIAVLAFREGLEAWRGETGCDEAGAPTFGAQLAMGPSWRIGVAEHGHTTLVTAGVFALVRNPIFSAMILTAAGSALMVPNVALAGLAMLVAAVELQVRLVEEPYLQRANRAPYGAYAARVGRFLPGLGLRRETTDGR